MKNTNRRIGLAGNSRFDPAAAGLPAEPLDKSRPVRDLFFLKRIIYGTGFPRGPELALSEG